MPPGPYSFIFSLCLFQLLPSLSLYFTLILYHLKKSHKHSYLNLAISSCCPSVCLYSFHHCISRKTALHPTYGIAPNSPNCIASRSAALRTQIMSLARILMTHTHLYIPICIYILIYIYIYILLLSLFDLSTSLNSIACLL